MLVKSRLPRKEVMQEGRRWIEELSILVLSKQSVVATTRMIVFKVSELPSNQIEFKVGDDNAGSQVYSQMPVAEMQSC